MKRFGSWVSGFVLCTALLNFIEGKILLGIMLCIISVSAMIRTY